MYTHFVDDKMNTCNEFLVLVRMLIPLNGERLVAIVFLGFHLNLDEVTLSLSRNLSVPKPKEATPCSNISPN